MLLQTSHRSEREKATTGAIERPISSLAIVEGRLIRSILRRDGSSSWSDLGEVGSVDPATDLEALADALWLQRNSRPAYTGPRPDIRLADLFSGCGLLSVGALEGTRAL